MKSFVYSLCFLCLCLSCRRNAETVLQTGAEIYIPKYTKGFTINEVEEGGGTLITVNNPWQGAKDVSSCLLINRNEDNSTSFNGQIIKDEAKRIICMSSTHIGMLDALEATDRIVGVSGKQYVSNEKIRENDAVKDIGYEGNIDYETLISLNPDLVLLFSINGESAMARHLEELGIPYIYVGDYVEESPLGKVEWIVPISEIIGKREKGIEVFKGVAERYDSLKNLVKKSELKAPKVMLNAPFADSWFMPSTESYVAMMMDDAGADYIYKKNTGSTSKPIDLEEAYLLVSQADYWLNIGGIKDLKELKKTFPKFIDTECVKTDKLYNNNLKSTDDGGNDCYESGAVNQDLILRDLIKIFHPELIEDDFVYYKRLE